MILIIKSTSANILIVGGAAMLAAIRSIHHMAITGLVNSIPLLINSLRDSEFS